MAQSTLRRKYRLAELNKLEILNTFEVKLVSLLKSKVDETSTLKIDGKLRNSAEEKQCNNFQEMQSFLEKDSELIIDLRVTLWCSPNFSSWEYSIRLHQLDDPRFAQFSFEFPSSESSDIRSLVQSFEHKCGLVHFDESQLKKNEILESSYRIPSFDLVAFEEAWERFLLPLVDSPRKIHIKFLEVGDKFSPKEYDDIEEFHRQHQNFENVKIFELKAMDKYIFDINLAKVSFRLWDSGSNNVIAHVYQKTSPEESTRAKQLIAAAVNGFVSKLGLIEDRIVYPKLERGLKNYYFTKNLDLNKNWFEKYCENLHGNSSRFFRGSIRYVRVREVPNKLLIISLILKNRRLPTGKIFLMFIYIVNISIA